MCVYLYIYVYILKNNSLVQDFDFVCKMYWDII